MAQVETALGRATVQNLAVQLRAGKIVITGDARTGFVRLPLRMTLAVDVRAGRLVVKVLEATVADVPLPESARQQMERTLQKQVDQAVAGENVRVRAVTVEGGKMTARVYRV